MDMSTLIRHQHTACFVAFGPDIVVALPGLPAEYGLYTSRVTPNYRIGPPNIRYLDDGQGKT